MLKILKIIGISILVLLLMGAKNDPAGYGLIANNMLGPVTIFSDFINSACILLGGLFIFASLVKYFEHRRSPLMVPISTVVFLLVAGILLFILPLIYVLLEGGSPFASIRSLLFL